MTWVGPHKAEHKDIQSKERSANGLGQMGEKGHQGKIGTQSDQAGRGAA